MYLYLPQAFCSARFFHIHRIAVGILAIAGCLPASLRLLAHTGQNLR